MPRLHGRFLITPCPLLVLLLIVLTYSILHISIKHSGHQIYHAHREDPQYSQWYLRNITKRNSKEIIRHADVYGSVNEKTLVMVVLVDRSFQDIDQFLSSLSEVRGIEDALVIFSHAYYDQALNNIIENIDFCRVLQIFYPYSVQIYPRAFPGRSSEDCPSNMNKKTALTVNCTGASFPDFRGHYRNPIQAERKHHWWWTTNQVFEKLHCTQKHSGNIIFLEDDFIFMKDFVYMALYLKNIAVSLPCDFISLGTNSVVSADFKSIYSASLTTWDPKIHSGVLAFGITTWNSIAAHYEPFCNFDDTSWSRTLHYISLNRKDGKRFSVLSSVTPRAFKINACHVYGCDTVGSQIKKLLRFEKENEASLFPPHVEVYIDIEIDDGIDFVFDYRESVGGWADPRDVALCRNMTSSKMKRVLMEMENDVSDSNEIEY